MKYQISRLFVFCFKDYICYFFGFHQKTTLSHGIHQQRHTCAGLFWSIGNPVIILKQRYVWKWPFKSHQFPEKLQFLKTQIEDLWVVVLKLSHFDKHMATMTGRFVRREFRMLLLTNCLTWVLLRVSAWIWVFVNGWLRLQQRGGKASLGFYLFRSGITDCSSCLTPFGTAMNCKAVKSRCYRP